MKMPRMAVPVGFAVSAALVIAGVTPARASTATPDTGPVEVSVLQTGSVAGEAEITTSVDSELGFIGEAEVHVDEYLLDEVSVTAEVAGAPQTDTYSISGLTIVDDENFTATLTSETTGESEYIDTTSVEPQVLPLILAVVARVGIQMAIRQFSKVAIQNAARQFALSLNSTKWAHIMASKHNWRYLRATTRQKVADLMSKAVANGRASKTRKHIDYVWRHNNRTITVRTSLSGHISNGWVR
ncbi:putative RNase toxin 35 of polymorphic toxin system [Curtobacterium sp. JUb34]|uniref:SAR2788 family putative toxin n=1 Tax=Curtobacterium sp. JUb34 TaxID=2485109 RepID=UPI000F46A05F|nr:SAR2788 family putative toxin [Curtobacterium sp. JUb34]ROR36731.1 putative RNase toxin 35 of polymorphic toxin system [Curtobacterium sp. JUb34]